MAKFELLFYSEDGQRNDIIVEAVNKEEAVKLGYEEISKISLDKLCVDLDNFSLHSIHEI